MSQALRESINNVEIIGTLKKFEAEEKVSKAGKDFITGKATIEVIEDSRINNIQVRFFSNKLKNNGELNGIYKGYKTVKDEYQVGDKVRVSGDLRLEEYYTQSGSLTSFNSVNGLFFNRIEEGSDFRPKAIATLDMVIESITHEVDAEGIPTDLHSVEAFTVGYNSRIIPLRNLVISEMLADQFSSMYYPGTTGKITLKINNYVDTETIEIEQEATGFGSTERVEHEATNFTNNLEIIGGDMPYSDGANEYSPEDIEQARKIRALALQELKQNSQASATPTGFGGTGSVVEKDNPEQHKKNLESAMNAKMENPPFEADAGGVTVTADDIPDF